MAIRYCDARTGLIVNTRVVGGLLVLEGRNGSLHLFNSSLVVWNGFDQNFLHRDIMVSTVHLISLHMRAPFINLT